MVRYIIKDREQGGEVISLNEADKLFCEITGVTVHDDMYSIAFELFTTFALTYLKTANEDGVIPSDVILRACEGCKKEAYDNFKKLVERFELQVLV
jgi:hypothetical protein